MIVFLLCLVVLRCDEEEGTDSKANLLGGVNLLGDVSQCTDVAAPMMSHKDALVNGGH